MMLVTHQDLPPAVPRPHGHLLLVVAVHHPAEGELPALLRVAHPADPHPAQPSLALGYKE